MDMTSKPVINIVMNENEDYSFLIFRQKAKWKNWQVIQNRGEGKRSQSMAMVNQDLGGEKGVNGECRP
jgi:hypothetical protein